MCIKFFARAFEKSFEKVFLKALVEFLHGVNLVYNKTSPDDTRALR